jgi:hypothetical protein
MQVIPLTNAGDRTILCFLGNNIGTLTFRSYYLPVSEAWHLDLRKTDGTTLVEGLVLNTAVDLIRGRPDLAFIGELRCVVLGEEGPSTESLGSTLFLVHFPPGDPETP